MALNIALIEPQIPPNTGNIARLCAATGTGLHLIGPLGFSLDSAEVLRAGLDYWDAVDLWSHAHWREFREAISRERCLYFSARATLPLWQARFPPTSCLVFGNETDGMPDRILEKHPERCFRIPMSGPVRSLNLATAAGIVLYEALRQREQNPAMPTAGTQDAPVPARKPAPGRQERPERRGSGVR